MRKTIGKLNCLIRPGADEKRVVLMLHGFGADAADLFPLADALDSEEQWTFVFPDAPLEVPIGPMMSGRGWFPISVRDLESGIDFTKIRPPGLDESTALVSEVIFELNPETLVIGGFSQGAMVSLNVCLENRDTIHGAVILSGALLDEATWKKQAQALSGFKYFQSHGAQDPVIPISAAQKLNDILKGAAWNGSFHIFSGGHEIPVPVVMKCREFIRSI